MRKAPRKGSLRSEQGEPPQGDMTMRLEEIQLVSQNEFQGNFPVHEDYETPTREELLAEAQRLEDLYHDKIVNFAGKERSVIVLDNIQTPQQASLLSRLAIRSKMWYHSSALCIPFELLRAILSILYRLVTEPSATLHALSSLSKSIKEDFSTSSPEPIHQCDKQPNEHH